MALIWQMPNCSLSHKNLNRPVARW